MSGSVTERFQNKRSPEGKNALSGNSPKRALYSTKTLLEKARIWNFVNLVQPFLEKTRIWKLWGEREGKTIKTVKNFAVKLCITKAQLLQL